MHAVHIRRIPALWHFDYNIIGNRPFALSEMARRVAVAKALTARWRWRNPGLRAMSNGDRFGSFNFD